MKGGFQMPGKRFYRILLPTVTFLGGVFIQLLLERWVSLGTVTTLSFVLVLISLAFLFTASLHILESIESKFSLIDKNLSNKFIIIQVPKEYANSPLAFAQETPFFNCIKHS